jgi:hypothetical protein
MRTRLIQAFLVIAISSFILIFPAYLRCSNLAEVNLFSTDLSFENSDQDDQLLDQHQDESKALVVSAFSIIFLPGTNPFEQIPRFFLLTSFLDQTTLILRC